MNLMFNDKLSEKDIKQINGLYNYNHPVKKIVSKGVQSTVEPETPKERPQVHLHDIMTHSEVAELLRVSSITLKRWGKLGKISCIRINSRGDRRYLREEIEKFMGGTK